MSLAGDPIPPEELNELLLEARSWPQDSWIQLWHELGRMVWDGVSFSSALHGLHESHRNRASVHKAQDSDWQDCERCGEPVIFRRSKGGANMLLDRRAQRHACGR